MNTDGLLLKLLAPLLAAFLCSSAFIWGYKELALPAQGGFQKLDGHPCAGGGRHSFGLARLRRPLLGV